MYYFAYDETLDRQRMQLLCPGAKAKYPVALPNHQLIFTGWSRTWRGGTANIRPFGGERVAGGVYEISEGELRRLDKEKGYPAVHNRREVTVFTEDNEPVKAVVYFRVVPGEAARPSPEYVALIRRGYREWGIA